jgi:hypothetical protein
LLRSSVSADVGYATNLSTLPGAEVVATTELVVVHKTHKNQKNLILFFGYQGFKSLEQDHHFLGRLACKKNFFFKNKMSTSSSNPFSFGLNIIDEIHKMRLKTDIKTLRKWKRYYDQRQVPRQKEIRTKIDKALFSQDPSEVQTILTLIKHLVFRHFDRRIHHFLKLFMQNRLSRDDEEAKKIFQLILNADSIPDPLFYKEMEHFYQIYRSIGGLAKPDLKFEDEDEIRLDKLRKLLSFKLFLCEIIAHSPELWKASEILAFMKNPYQFKDNEDFLFTIKRLLDQEILEWFQNQPPTIVEQYKRYLFYNYDIPKVDIDRVSKQFIVSPRALRNFFLLNKGLLFLLFCPTRNK